MMRILGLDPGTATTGYGIIDGDGDELVMGAYKEAIREEYLEVFREFVDTFRRGCAEARIEYVPVDTSVPYELLLAAFLTKRTRLG